MNKKFDCDHNICPWTDSSSLSPILIHCSAGVGRTGTLIALDTLIAAIDAGKSSIDIFGVVYAMRQDRCLLVKTYFHLIQLSEHDIPK
jgi:protein tyrosine phosphatase